MADEVIVRKTKDGEKLFNATTGELAGSRPKKAQEPSVSSVGRSSKKSEEFELSNERNLAIDSAYSKFQNAEVQKSLTRHGLPTEKNQGISTIQNYVMDMYDKEENNQALQKTEAEILEMMLFELEGLNIKREEIDPTLSSLEIEEILTMIEEAKEHYRSFPYPGSSDYDPSMGEGLLSDAFEKLGFPYEEAYKRSSTIFENLSWNPPF